MGRNSRAGFVALAVLIAGCGQTDGTGQERASVASTVVDDHQAGSPAPAATKVIEVSLPTGSTGAGDQADDNAETVGSGGAATSAGATAAGAGATESATSTPGGAAATAASTGDASTQAAPGGTSTAGSAAAGTPATAGRLAATSRPAASTARTT